MHHHASSLHPLAWDPRAPLQPKTHFFPPPPSLHKPLALPTDNPTRSSSTLSMSESEGNKDRDKGEHGNRILRVLNQTGQRVGCGPSSRLSFRRQLKACFMVTLVRSLSIIPYCCSSENYPSNTKVGPARSASTGPLSHILL